MSLPRTTNFIDIFNIDLTEIGKSLSWIFIGHGLIYALKKLQIPLKSKQLYFGLRGLKYQLLYNYEGWRISRKRKGPKYMNYEMSKKEKQYFCQMMLSDVAIKSDLDEDNQRFLQLLVQQAYPEAFRKIFGETKAEIRARLNIKKFFQTVFV
jgi:hypothetical protein